MVVRELRWNDFDALTESYWELYDERARGEPIGISLFAERPSRAAEARWFSDLVAAVETGEKIVVVAELDGRAVGQCTIGPTFPGGPGSDGAHVGELGILVDHRYRGRGLGREMIVRALEQARARYEIVRLWVFSTNERAKRLYLSLGFLPSGRQPYAVRRGSEYIDAELMWLDLRRWKAPPSVPKH